MAVTQNQIAHFTIEVEDDRVEFDVPASTVGPITLTQRVNETLKLYIDLTEVVGAKMSLGDFAMFLASKASNDPREQDYGKDDE